MWGGICNATSMHPRKPWESCKAAFKATRRARGLDQSAAVVSASRIPIKLSVVAVAIPAEPFSLVANTTYARLLGTREGGSDAEYRMLAAEKHLVATLGTPAGIAIARRSTLTHVSFRGLDCAHTNYGTPDAEVVSVKYLRKNRWGG